MVFRRAMISKDGLMCFDPDEIHQKVVEAAKKYAHKTAPETIKLIKSMDEKFNIHLDYIKKEITDINCKMDRFISTSEVKYASKWVEKVVSGFVALVLVAVIGGIIKLVLVQ